MTTHGSNIQQTALITGASSGIGAALGQRFAADGIDLVLVARDAGRLAGYAESIESRYGVRTTVLAQDLTEPDAAAKLLSSVQQAGISVDYLVNNAGMGMLGDFAALPLERQLAVMQLNMNALVALTHGFLPAMLARRSGRILNVASVAALQPGGPGAAVYYASKAFVLSFSRGLAAELSGQGVSVTALCPGPVATRFAAVGGFDRTPLFRGPFLLGADRVADAGYRAMQRGKLTCLPGLYTKLCALGSLFPAQAIALAVNRALLEGKD